MKNTTKKRLMAGSLVCTLALGGLTITAAEETPLKEAFQTIQAVFNSVTISTDSAYLPAGEGYELENGQTVPSSILYEGTTYLPIRKLGELLEQDVQWDGETSTVRLTDAEKPLVQQAVETACQYFEMPKGQMLSAEEVEARYGLDPDSLASYCLMPPSFIVSASEISIVEVKDAADIPEVKEAFKKQQETIMKSFEFYLRDQYEIAKNGIIGVQGNYVYLIMHKNASQVEDLLQVLLAAPQE
ncbi:MAG: DUF4358 domain-containing protein [Eubacteriales bacterium]|jgi:hypothetical protein